MGIIAIRKIRADADAEIIYYYESVNFEKNGDAKIFLDMIVNCKSESVIHGFILYIDGNVTKLEDLSNDFLSIKLEIYYDKRIFSDGFQIKDRSKREIKNFDGLGSSENPIIVGEIDEREVQIDRYDGISKVTIPLKRPIKKSEFGHAFKILFPVKKLAKKVAGIGKISIPLYHSPSTCKVARVAQELFGRENELIKLRSEKCFVGLRAPSGRSFGNEHPEPSRKYFDGKGRHQIFWDDPLSILKRESEVLIGPWSDIQFIAEFHDPSPTITFVYWSFLLGLLLGLIGILLSLFSGVICC